MCNVAVIEFFVESVEKEEFEGKRVLEVGSKYVNGSVRPLIERFLRPREYVGVDIEPGKFVDVVLPAERLVEHFGPESFDVVIATELLEHVQDWRLVVNNMKAVLRRGGYIYITTRSYGFPSHAYPYDFWRYEVEDMKRIFGDFEIIRLARDREAPEVFMKARKPFDYHPKDLQSVALYSMILGRRTTSIPSPQEMPLSRKAKLLAHKVMDLVGGAANRLLMNC
jgi:SAM-dependent methyltransferase